MNNPELVCKNKYVSCSKNLMITGPPGIGKTTLVQRVIEAIPNIKICGFITHEIRVNNTRVGFKIEAVGGQSSILAHVNYSGKPKIGRYGVDLAALEKIGVGAILQGIESADLIVIDEIGKMELMSNSFKAAVLQAFNSPTPVLATIMLKPHPFADELKQRGDAILLKMNLENRDTLLRQILDILKKLLASNVQS